MSERFTPNAAAHALVIDNDRILMLRRFNTGWMDGLYTTPTGHIEKDESATEAAVRELHEETGLQAESAQLEHAITVHRQNELKGVYFDNYFVVREWSGEPSITEPEKSDAIEWLPIGSLDDNVVPTVLRALRAFRAGKHYMEDGWNMQERRQKEVLEDNARKFVISTINPEFLKASNTTGYLLVTDWLETGEDNEKKLARKEFENGDVQILLISKVTVDGNRTSEKEKITEEQYEELITGSISHVEKMRYEFKYIQDGVEFDIKYDEFMDSSLRVLEVDASSDADRELFTADERFKGAREVTGDLQYYGYRVAEIV